MLQSLLPYAALLTACVALAIAWAALRRTRALRRSQSSRSERRRSSLRLRWNLGLPDISLNRELKLIAQPARSPVPGLVEQGRLDLEAAERDGVAPEQIAFLYLYVMHMLQTNPAGQVSFTDNFLEHRLLRRLLQDRQNRRAWGYARRIAGAERASMIDAYLREQYPREWRNLRQRHRAS